MDLLFKIRKFIDDSGLIDPGDHLVIGVSGGIDSMCLAEILHRISGDIGFTISVVHVNHNLRGSESDNDEDFVREYCLRKEIQFFSRKWNGPKSGENMHDAARNFRLNEFIRTAVDAGAGKIVLAHNLNDQAETVIFNLIRGTGPDGMGGMSPVSVLDCGISLVRPFIRTSRSEIEQFAKDESVGFRTDRTNEESKYTRNFIRHKILPLMNQINPSVIDSITESADGFREDEQYFNEVICGLSADTLKVSVDKAEINSCKYCVLSRAIRVRILKAAYVRINGSVTGLARDHLKRMDQIALNEKKEGSYNLPNGLKYEKKGQILAIFKNRV